MPQKSVFILPTVHMNGTSHRMLTEDYEAAADALNAFITAFGRIEFNARDYYPQGPQAWPAAREQREEMHRHVNALQGYLDEHRMSLYDQSPQPPRPPTGA